MSSRDESSKTPPRGKRYQNPFLDDYKSSHSERAESTEDRDARFAATLGSAVGAAMAQAGVPFRPEGGALQEENARRARSLTILGLVVSILALLVSGASAYAIWRSMEISQKVNAPALRAERIRELKQELNDLGEPTPASSAPAPEPPIASPVPQQVSPQVLPPMRRVTPAPREQMPVPQSIPDAPNMLSQVERRRTASEQRDRAQESRLESVQQQINDLGERVVNIETSLGREVTIAAEARNMKTFTVKVSGLTSAEREQLKQLLSTGCSVPVSNVRTLRGGAYQFEAPDCQATAFSGLPSDVKVVIVPSTAPEVAEAQIQ